MDYNGEFARFYQLELSDYPRSIAPAIIGLWQQALTNRGCRKALDLCCGTGHLADSLCRASFDVTGVDLSPEMLAIAREVLKPHLDDGSCRLVQGDVTCYRHDGMVDLVTATSDSVNHMPHQQGVRDLFISAWSPLVSGGLFVFDMITPRGLSRWGRTSITKDPLMIRRGSFDPCGKTAKRQMVSYLELKGEYCRFSGELEYLVISPERIRKMLSEAGFEKTRFHPVGDFSVTLQEPEKHLRVMVSCWK